MMNPTWLSRPIRDSSSLCLTLDLFRRVLMSPVHILTLSLGNAMMKALLLIVQPNIFWFRLECPRLVVFRLLGKGLGLWILLGQEVGTQREGRRVWRVDLVTGDHRHLHLSRWRRRCNHR